MVPDKRKITEKERKELEEIAMQLIKKRGSSKINMVFFIPNFKAKLETILEEKKIGGSVRAKTIGGSERNFKIKIEGFKDTSKPRQPKKTSIPSATIKQESKFKLPKINTSSENVDELYAQKTIIKNAEAKAKRIIDKSERASVESQLKSMKFQVEGKINEVSSEKYLKAKKGAIIKGKQQFGQKPIITTTAKQETAEKQTRKRKEKTREPPRFEREIRLEQILSPAELKVASISFTLLSKGKGSLKNIAREAGIAENTANIHLNKIRTKLKKEGVKFPSLGIRGVKAEKSLQILAERKRKLEEKIPKTHAVNQRLTDASIDKANRMKQKAIQERKQILDTLAEHGLTAEQLIKIHAEEITKTKERMKLLKEEKQKMQEALAKRKRR